MKDNVADVIHKAFESIPVDIITWSDCSEQFIFEPDGKLHNEFFDNNRSLSVEDFCLDRFRKTVNGSNFYDNGGGYVHQSNGMVREFHLHLSDSKLQNAATTTSHLYTLFASMFEKKHNDKRWNNVGSNTWMRKAVLVSHCLLYDVFSIKII